MSALTLRSLEFLVVTLLAFSQLAWVLPEELKSLQKPGDIGSGLDYLVISVNGRLNRIANTGELSFIKGDVLKFEGVVLKDRSRNPRTVYLRGYGARGTELRGRTIDTAQDVLSESDALDQRGEVFAVVVQTKDLLHGHIFLHQIEPSLGYVDVLVNGKVRVMREGESLLVKKSDNFKIKKVVTNIRKNKDISFSVVPEFRLKQEAKSDVEHYQILFKHRNRLFSKIPLSVETL